MGLLWLFDDSFKKFDRKRRENKIVRKLKSRKDSWIGHILRRNCLLKHVVKGKIERNIEWKRRRREQLLDEFKETKGHWKFKEEALDRSVWKSDFGRA